MTKADIELAILKTDLKNIKEKIGMIETNHLPHIYDRLGSIEKRLAYWMGGIAALIIITQIVVPFMLKGG